MVELMFEEELDKKDEADENLKFEGDKVKRGVGGGAETIVYHYANLFVIIITGMELQWNCLFCYICL